MDEVRQIDLGIFFDAAPNAQLVFTPDLRIVAANRCYCNMLGRRPEDLIGIRVFEAFPANPDDPDADAEAELQASTDAVVATGEAQEMPLRQHDVSETDGRYGTRYWRILNSPVFADASEPDRVTHIIHTAEDVTRSVLGERADAAKRRAAMRGAELSYFELDPASGWLTRSPKLDELFGFEPGETVTTVQSFLDRIHPDDHQATIAEIERGGRIIGSDLRFDYRILRPDGTMRWVIGRGESVRDADTQDVSIVGIVLDVTLMREREENLREAVEARDLLIAEVNHRVKNSLQMVTSILNLEANATEDSAARASLRAATARVNSIAAIHASLYEDDDVRTVQIDKYLERLTRHLRASLESEGWGVRITLEVEPIRLPTDKAVTLSLVVNELVTNSFKHAFGQNDDGTVSVSLRRDDGNTIILEVSDDGTGSGPDRSDQSTPSSGLGQRLIAGMAAQLGGTIEEENTSGWKTRISFVE
ncbi:putative sensor histidine kinase pdtaS [Rhodobacteraceae bacterium THAF1]|uniref:sensor histidine kinase n=1 Tax=Palleronia sp. THAF1 TaxID=2587842 RepID=UPI000F41D8A2|nr:histidine kinase dimerization/phosphoacceptor domain -containing protein [Palleronia sp. THAF1]QFU07191.1 putative sensor histidine kinase pdtaS [Palleronia sp. THAF1]VDC16575.1 putative sensor histidine kinase pdtaS [Rhodobacteraceae bacterium THAF1]